LPPPNTIDPAALDRFIDSLLDAGFEPVGDQRSWDGPIHPSLVPLTSETRMRVGVRDGFPFYHPTVTVKGLPLGRHRNHDGDICLWDVGDSSLEWLTWAGIATRVELWATEAQGHPTEDDPGLDPDRTFSGARLGLATINLTNRAMNNWDIGLLHAKREDWGLKIGRGEGEPGRWYVLDRPKEPPQTFEELAAQLRRHQRKDLRAAIASVGKPDGATFAVFAWNTPAGPNLLILGFERTNADELKVGVYEAARTDADVLRLRSGPDSTRLATRSVLLFGAGAIGSHVARLLPRSGLRKIVLVDGDTLRPGDVVRHGSSGLFVGSKKASAAETANFVDAPWTETEAHDLTTWDPVWIARRIAGADLVVDAVGSVGFTAQLSRLCRQAEVAMLSVALYRGGTVGRVRVQSPYSEIQVADRGKDDRFLAIPPGALEDAIAWETGCASPVVQAPPTSVASIGASASRLAIQVLTGRETGDLDFVESYEPLPESPFESPGVWRCRA
jgi:molybdopterin/thiamine biosynthesis adenylyltransferase